MTDLDLLESERKKEESGAGARLKHQARAICFLGFFFLNFLTFATFAQSITPDMGQIPVFSKRAGFYNSSITVALLSNTPNSVIYYTLDGSDPEEFSMHYTSPIEVNNTLTIRARYCLDSSLQDRIATGTFFINEKITLPVVSLATDPGNLYDPEYGIFLNSDPYCESNLFQDWERPVHVEFFEADGTPGFSLDAGVKVHGGLTRIQAQKALNIYARKVYGTGKIDFKLFPDRPADSYEAFVLRNGGNDFKWSLFRDEMMHSIVAGVMGLEQGAFRPVVVFLNGSYYGIQHIREKISDEFIETNTNVSEDKIDMLEYIPYTEAVKVINGSSGDYAELTDFLNTHDLANDEFYKVVADQVDIQNFINYQVSQIYFDNGDWPGNNVKWWRPNDPIGKWRWILFDTDFGFGLNLNGNEGSNQVLHYLHNTLITATHPTGSPWPNPPYATLLLRSLLKNPGFKNQFINTFCDHLNTSFRAERVKRLINSMKTVLEPEIPRHHQKYGESAGYWNTEVKVMNTFADLRVSNVFSHLQSKFNLERAINLTLDATEANQGIIRINNLVLDSLPWTGRYFPNIPVTLTAIPKPGHRFRKWSNGVTSLTRIYKVKSQDVIIYAEFEPSPDVTDGSVLINEINFNSSPDFDTKDWVELYNNSDATINLSNWKFQDNSDSHTFFLPSHLNLEPFSFLILCRSSTLFHILQPDVKTVLGDLSFKFSSVNDELRLFNARGELIDQVSYAATSPWPDLAGKEGYTIELTDPDLDNSLAANWKISGVFTGSPGAHNSPLMSVEQLENESSISRVYPNPFAVSVTIEYQGEKLMAQSPGQIHVVIFSITGQTIKILVDAIQPFSNHQVTWDGTDASGSLMPAGIYYCRIIIGNQQQCHKLLLIR